MEGKTFEKVVLDLVKRFSPQKKSVNLPVDSLIELKEVVRNNILSSPTSCSFLITGAATSSQSASTSSTCNEAKVDYGICTEDEDSRMSCFDSSEDSHSHYSNEDESCRASVSSGRRLFKPCSSTSQSLQPKGCKQSTRARRLQELRQSRRKTARTEESQNFDCPEKEFPLHFSEWYNTQLNGCLSVVRLYHLIINTTREYFTKITWDRNIESLVLTFLRENVLRSNSQLNDFYESGTIHLPDSVDRGNRRLLETRLQILVELHVMSISKSSPDLDDVVRKFRFIYVAAGALSMRSFLEEEIADNFAHIIPREVICLYDELCISIPADLEEHDPNSGFPMRDEFMFPWFQYTVATKTEQSRHLEQLLEEAAISDSVDLFCKENNRKQVQQKITGASRVYGTSSTLSKCDVPKGKRNEVPRVLRTVLDTPEDKLRVKLEPMEDDICSVPEVVKQTPIGKLRGNRKSCRRLSELVKISEERARPSRAAAIASEKASKALIKATSSISAGSCRELLLGLNTPSPRPHRSARLNLIDRFCSEPSSSAHFPTATSPRKMHLIASIKAAPLPEPATPDRKRLRTSVTPSPQRTHSHGQTTALCLGKEQLARYRQRMTEIARTKDVDFSRCSQKQRTSLYEAVEREEHGVQQKDVQKNRTGRTVRTSTTVHLAHILLNVNNPTPLEAFKAPKLSVGTNFKVQRLVRIAKKREKKKLNRLRQRIVRFNTCPSSPSTSHNWD